MTRKNCPNIRDRISEVYEGVGDRTTVELARKRIHWMCSRARGPLILDLGCSQGIASILLGRDGQRVVALDLEEAGLRFGLDQQRREDQANPRRVCFIQGDGGSLPLSRRGFDSALLGEVIEHADDPQSILKEVSRVLKPEGRLLLTVPFGVLVHEDHKRSYYLHSLFQTLRPLFSIENMEIQDNRYLRIMARNGPAGEAEIGAKQWRLQEQAFEAREESYLQDTQRLQTKLDESNRRYRDVTATLSQLREASAGDQRVFEEVSRLGETVAAASQSCSEQIQALLTAQDEIHGALRRSLEEGFKERDSALARIEDKAEALLDRLGDGSLQLSELKQLASAQGTRMERALSLLDDESIQEIRTLSRRRRPGNGFDNVIEEAIRRIERFAVPGTNLRAPEAPERALLHRVDELGCLLEAAVRGKADYREKYVNAVRSFQHEKKRSQGLMKAQQVLRGRIRRIETSRTWRAARLYWRLRSEFLRGGWSQKKLFLQSCLRVLKRKLAARKAAAPRRDLVKFLQATAEQAGENFVFMLSGTTHIQEQRGNRPIRMTKTLVSQGIPVLFSYWRWNRSDPIPENSGSNLLQWPMDLIVPELSRIARASLPAKRILVITFPHLSCARCVNLFNAAGWLTIYDVRDDWEEFHKVGQAKWYNRSVEQYLVNNAGRVTAVSRPLRDKIQGMLARGQVELSPNALDADFLTGRKRECRSRTESKVVGYFGHLTAAWFDWDSLIWTARRMPAFRFEIIGHSMPGGIRLPSNVSYLGPKNHDEVRRIARSWKAAMIPFKPSPLADAVDPIKVYEYLALGLPVVSFRMPQIHDYPGVFIAASREEFRLALQRAAEARLDLDEVDDFLSRNRWEDRVRALLSGDHGEWARTIRSISSDGKP